jgi:hypothetical protein
MSAAAFEYKMILEVELQCTHICYQDTYSWIQRHSRVPALTTPVITLHLSLSVAFLSKNDAAIVFFVVDFSGTLH